MTSAESYKSLPQGIKPIDVVSILTSLTMLVSRRLEAYVYKSPILLSGQGEIETADAASLIEPKAMLI